MGSFEDEKIAEMAAESLAKQQNEAFWAVAERARLRRDEFYGRVDAKPTSGDKEPLPPPTYPVHFKAEWDRAMYVARERGASLAARYAAFRETVERVVGEEAPNARVVTDWSGRDGLCWLELGDVTFAFQVTMGGQYLEQDVRAALGDFCEQLGDRAMGKR